MSELVRSSRLRGGLILVVLAALSCAAPPLAEGPIDWVDADERWSIHVVTTNADGSDRVTRVWLALLDGQGVFRTNDSRWWANILREPRLRVRHADADHPFRVEMVNDLPGRVAIDEAFAEKYGTWEWMLFPQARGSTHENYGRLIAE